MLHSHAPSKLMGPWPWPTEWLLTYGHYGHWSIYPSICMPVCLPILLSTYLSEYIKTEIWKYSAFILLLHPKQFCIYISILSIFSIILWYSCCLYLFICSSICSIYLSQFKSFYLIFRSIPFHQFIPSLHSSPARHPNNTPQPPKWHWRHHPRAQQSQTSHDGSKKPWHLPLEKDQKNEWTN